MNSEISCKGQIYDEIIKVLIWGATLCIINCNGFQTNMLRNTYYVLQSSRLLMDTFESKSITKWKMKKKTLL